MHGSPCKFRPSFCGFSAIERERAPPLSHSRPARVFAHVPVKGRAGPLHGEPHLLCLLGRAVLVPVASDLLGCRRPPGGACPSGKDSPRGGLDGRSGDADFGVFACGFDVVLPTGPPRFLRECLRLKDYEIYGFAVLAADRAGCGFADALVGCTGGVLVPPFSAYPQR